jgi:hypothetical protein
MGEAAMPEALTAALAAAASASAAARTAADAALAAAAGADAATARVTELVARLQSDALLLHPASSLSLAAAAGPGSLPRRIFILRHGESQARVLRSRAAAWRLYKGASRRAC